jgi:hypothetical protein
MPVSGPGDEMPVLKIRKDTEKQLTYHYDREERVALRRSAPKATKRSRRFFRLVRAGRKPLLLLLIGVLAIVLVSRLLPRGHSTGHLAGYEVSLRATVYQGALLASVTVSWKPRAGEGATEAAEATVRFSTSAAGAASVTSEPLSGGEAVVRGRLPYTAADRQVIADVSIGGSTRRLTAAVGKPAVGKP